MCVSLVVYAEFSAKKRIVEAICMLKIFQSGWRMSDADMDHQRKTGESGY